jgi:hypothetical protein
VSLIAPGNLGTSIAGAFLAVLYLPVTALAMVSEFARRARDRRRRQPP